MKITDYRIIKATSPDQIERKVEDAMKFGWQPQGGISFVNPVRVDDYCFFQAVIKIEKPRIDDPEDFDPNASLVATKY